MQGAVGQLKCISGSVFVYLGQETPSMNQSQGEKASIAYYLISAFKGLRYAFEISREMYK